MSVTARLPKEMLRELETLARDQQIDRSELVRRLIARALAQVRSERALDAYSKGQITLWRSAKLAGISLREMMELARQSGIAVPYGPDELERDIAYAKKQLSGE